MSQAQFGPFASKWAKEGSDNRCYCTSSFARWGIYISNQTPRQLARHILLDYILDPATWPAALIDYRSPTGSVDIDNNTSGRLIPA